MSNLQRKRNICYGIECYLRKMGFRTTTKSVSNITAEFLKSRNLPYTKFNPRYKGLFTADIANAELVSEHFEEFKLFIKEKKQNAEN